MGTSRSSVRTPALFAPFSPLRFALKYVVPCGNYCFCCNIADEEALPLDEDTHLFFEGVEVVLEENCFLKLVCIPYRNFIYPSGLLGQFFVSC